MQVNPTIAAGDFKVSIDGAALANLGTLPAVTPAGSSMVKFTLSTSEMAGANATVICSDAAGSEWCDLTINIPTTARQVDDLAFPATSGRSMVVDAAGLVDANVVKVGPTGSGTAQTARDIGGAVPAAVPGAAGGLFIAGTNAATTVTTSLTTTFTGNLTGSVGSVTGAVGSVTGAVGSVTGNVGGNVVGSVASVTGNVGGNVVGSVASVTGAVGSVTGAVGSVTGNVGGNVVGSVASVTGAVGSVTGAVGSVTGNVGGNVVGSVASVTGAVGSVTGAVGSVTGAVGSVTGNVGGNLLGTLSTTERNAISDAMLDRNMATGTDSGTTTIRTMRQALRFLRNKWTISGGTITITKEDDTTSSWTGTVTQTAGNPVSQIDPAG